MASNDVEGSGTPQDPWVLKTPPGTSEFDAYTHPPSAVGNVAPPSGAGCQT